MDETPRRATDEVSRTRARRDVLGAALPLVLVTVASRTVWGKGMGASQQISAGCSVCPSQATTMRTTTRRGPAGKRWL